MRGRPERRLGHADHRDTRFGMRLCAQARATAGVEIDIPVDHQQAQSADPAQHGPQRRQFPQVKLARLIGHHHGHTAVVPTRPPLLSASGPSRRFYHYAQGDVALGVALRQTIDAPAPCRFRAAGPADPDRAFHAHMGRLCHLRAGALSRQTRPGRRFPAGVPPESGSREG